MDIFRSLRGYFSNQTQPPFIQDPFQHIVLAEEKDNSNSGDGSFKRKVGFQELFYDLFVVAALSVCSGSNNLNNAPDVGSYIVFFAALWAIWASQTVFNVRYGTKDGLMWMFSYLQLCVFGIFASVSGDFDLTVGFSVFEASGGPVNEEEYTELTTVAHWVRHPIGELGNTSATLRSLKVASATFAASRLLLFVQYTIVFYYARKHKRETRPIFWHLGGLFVSSMLWWGALAASFHATPSEGIARIALWATGLAFEFLCMAGAASSQSQKIDLEYWAERFSAVTLIVLGEGILSLFEAFESVLSGPTVGLAASDRSAVAGLIVSAIGLYRVLYYLYFDQHSHNIRGGALGHGLWGCIHFPLHLSILLLTQCIAHIIFATNIYLATYSITLAFENMIVAVYAAVATGDMTVVQETLLLSPQARSMQDVMSSIAVDWNANVANLLTYGHGNVALMVPLVAGEMFSCFSQVVTNYHFQPGPAVYKIITEALDSPDPVVQTQLIDEFKLSLMKPVFVSMQYGFTVLGGAFVCLGLLSMLQRDTGKLRTRRQSKLKRSALFFERITTWYRFLLGIVLLLLSLLNIGPFYKTSELEGKAAPMYTLMNGVIFLPILFAISTSACILDFGVFLWEQHNQKGRRHRQEVEVSPDQVNGIQVLHTLEAQPEESVPTTPDEKVEK